MQRRRTAPVPAPLDASALHRIDQFIDRHLDSHVSVDELAALVGMGVFRFSRLFKLATGKPPYQYNLHKRIERAKSILAEQSVSISDVASSCGFASQSHFTDVFRRTAGVTPRRFAWVARGGRNILTDARSRRGRYSLSTRTRRPTKPNFQSVAAPVSVLGQLGFPLTGRPKGHSWTYPTQGVSSGVIANAK